MNINLLAGRDSKNLYKIDKIRVTLSPGKGKEEVLCVQGSLIRNRSWPF